MQITTSAAFVFYIASLSKTIFIVAATDEIVDLSSTYIFSRFWGGGGGGGPEDSWG